MAPWLEPLRSAMGALEGLATPEHSPSLAGLQNLTTPNCTPLLTVPRDSDSKQPSDAAEDGDRELALNEFQIIKAVVLTLVTSIILLSICKMVFQLFVRYAAKADDR